MHAVMASMQQVPAVRRGARHAGTHHPILTEHRQQSRHAALNQEELARIMDFKP